MEFPRTRYPQTFLPLIVKFENKSRPFNEPYFDSTITTQVSVYEWWKSHKSQIGNYDSDLFSVIEQLQTAHASVERQFSSFGVVQSSLRGHFSVLIFFANFTLII